MEEVARKGSRQIVFTIVVQQSLVVLIGAPSSYGSGMARVEDPPRMLKN
jgi:hypothetical protein